MERRLKNVTDKKLKHVTSLRETEGGREGGGILWDTPSHPILADKRKKKFNMQDKGKLKSLSWS